MHMALKLWSCLDYKARLTDITCLGSVFSPVSLKVPWVTVAAQLHIDRLLLLIVGSQNTPSDQMCFHPASQGDNQGDKHENWSWLPLNLEILLQLAESLNPSDFLLVKKKPEVAHFM